MCLDLGLRSVGNGQLGSSTRSNLVNEYRAKWYLVCSSLSPVTEWVGVCQWFLRPDIEDFDPSVGSGTLPPSGLEVFRLPVLESLRTRHTSLR